MLALLLSSWIASAGPIELILHNPVGRTRPADVCDVRLCTSLVERIDASKTSIDLALYGMRNQTGILSALARARARGVEIRVVVDRDVNGDNYYSSTPQLIAVTGNVQDDEYTDRATAREKKEQFESDTRCKAEPGFQGPPQCIAYDLGDSCVIGVHASREPLNFQGDIMHHKFAVIDGQHVWTGSTNASDSGTGGYNANLVVLVDDAEVASWYTAEFNQMWSERYHKNKALIRPARIKTLSDGTGVAAYFSPQDRPMSNVVRPLLQKATTSVDVAVFFLTHKGATADLIAAHRRGVKVRAILDATAAGNGYTKHEALRLAGIPVKVENWGGKMHAKSAVIDGKILVTGSMNWTSAGEGGNDENTLILRSEALGTQYQQWFDTLWASIDDKWLEGRPAPESRDSGTACTDGVDNDFDHKADDEDPSCGEDPPALPPLPKNTVVPKRGNRCPMAGEL